MQSLRRKVVQALKDGVSKRSSHGHAHVWDPKEEAIKMAEFKKRWALNEPTTKEIKAGAEVIAKGSWKNFFIAIPLGTIPALYILANEHHHEREVKYPYLRIRSKPFPWGNEDLMSVPIKGEGKGHH